MVLVLAERTLYRSANHPAVLLNDPAIARSMDQFSKVNHLVYKEWSTERRRRGLEEGRLVSGKNKVIQESRSARQQWGKELNGE